jgi:hypothetical protein
MPAIIETLLHAVWLDHSGRVPAWHRRPERIFSIGPNLLAELVMNADVPGWSTVFD